MTTTAPCLRFDVGVAEEAAEHYVAIFPRSRVDGVLHHGPGPQEGQVVTVDVTLDGQAHVGLDGGPVFTSTEAVSLQIRCDGQDEVDHYWSALTQGGEEGPCGWSEDRFGVSRQVVPNELHALLHDADAGRAQRAAQALSGMEKIDVDGLRRAADGH